MSGLERSLWATALVATAAAYAFFFYFIGVHGSPMKFRWPELRIIGSPLAGAFALAWAAGRAGRDR